VTGTQPVKNLGGGGFTFEDRVGAWIAAAILAGAPPLDPDLGAPVRIDFQVAADGWRLDDALIGFERSRCCISVKSYLQIEHGRASQEFVTRAWEELLGLSGSGFDPDADLVAMVTPPLEADTRGDLQELIRLARAQAPSELAGRIAAQGYVSVGRRTLWDSFSLPDALAGADTGPVSNSPGEVVRRLRLLEADFEYSPSRALEQALSWCGQALADPSEAAELWEVLLVIVSEIRPAGGSVDVGLLSARLQRRFVLRERPDYESDWTLLRSLTERNMAQVPDSLAGGLRLDRAEILAQIEEAMRGARLVALVGPSGSGKTALAKAYGTACEDSVIVWLRAEEIAALTAPGGALRHRLLDTLYAANRPTWVIVDGLDRAFSEAADVAVAELVNAVEHDATSPLAVMITSQQQEWASIGDRLAARNAIAQWRVVAVSSFTDDELDTILDAYPALRDVVYRGRLTGVLRTPKVLDTILRALLAGRVDQSSPVSGEESRFAEWFYERLARGSGHGRASRGALVMRLAELQGDRLQPQTPLTELDPAGLEFLDQLEHDGVCAQREGRVRFTHDLYGDWARYQVIVAHDADRPEYVGARLTSPLWHRAIRLHALAILDSRDADAWRAEMTRLGGEQLGLLHDLFLEAPLFSAEPRPALERLWPTLIEGDGRLLRRLLARFLYVATVPHPGAVAAITSVAEELSTEVAATHRLPYWPLWLPLLGALSDHAEEAATLAGDPVARITDLWLRWTPDDWPLREQAANLALARARGMLADEQATAYGADEARARAWRAMLAAVRERRDDVIEISRLLAPDRDEQGDPTSEAREEASARRPRVDRVFRETCLDSDALHPLIAADPALAGAILFAAMAPRPPRGFGIPGDELGVGRLAGWFVPLYTRGPFLAFLRAAPADARGFVLQLIDAATDRWAQTRGDGGGAMSVTMPLADGSTRELRGDEQVMQWYRGDAQVPSPIACALMALEKWLYDEADAGHDITEVVEDLLASTSSIAIVGLLIAIGCRDPQLFAGPLRPLLAMPELYVWDSRYKLHERQHLLIRLFREPAEFRRLAEEWFLLEHRRVTLEQRAQQLMLTDSAIASYLSQQVPGWRSRLDGDGEPAALRFLIARLDRTNWKERATEQGERYWECEPPAELRAESERTTAELQQSAFWLEFPGQCRAILDGQLALSEGTLDEFWAAVSARLLESPPDDVVSGGVISADDARCGAAGVLFVLHRGWLSQHPDREQQCLDWLLAAVAADRDRQWFESPRGGADWSWDSFCAQALPIVWAEQPQEPMLRRAIARLAFSLSYSTISRLFAACAEQRDRLGDDFGRLQHLGVHIALFRRATDVARNRAGARRPDRAAMEGRIGCFLDASLEPSLPAWAVLAAPPEGSRQSWGELDTGYLHAACRWIPPLDDARDATERAAWVAYFTESVKELVARLRRNIERRGGEVDGGPPEDDLDLLRALPARIIEMGADEARAVWEPILDIAPAAPRWVDSFLSVWCIVGLQTAPAAEGFVGKWEEMLDYIESSPAWRAPATGRAAELHDFLLGLGGTTLDMWSADHAQTVARFAARYERWARESLGRRDDAARFAQFLRRPGAAPLLADGLVWLAGADTPASSWHHDDHYEDAVGALLDQVARDQPELMRSGAPAGAAYRALLRRLADRQVPIALELIARLGEGGA
jgi:hypothetical protein